MPHNPVLAKTPRLIPPPCARRRRRPVRVRVAVRRAAVPVLGVEAERRVLGDWGGIVVR